MNLACFNSRPHEEVDCQFLRIFKPDLSFNSRPHEEVDCCGNAISKNVSVSTHDLTKRSTDYLAAGSQTKRVSTHDLTKRSTRGSTIGCTATLFQLTTSRRGRLFALRPALPEKHVSTHDLTKRSTRKPRIQDYATAKCFNSRPHEEVDSNFYAKSFPFKITFCAHCI